MNLRANLISWTLILLNIPVEIEGNHYQWWTCSAECRRCIRRTTPLEKWISEYYSGLFSREPPVAFYDSTQANPVNPNKTKDPGNPDNPGSQNNTGNPGNPGNPSNTGVPGNPGNPGNPNPHQYGCCETEFGHWAPNNTEFGGRKYTVVHLKQEYQFIPVGRCQRGTTCQQGECVQILRAHWILVYNNTKPLTSAPVSFVPIKIPSHCECLNIGRARP
ncbi:uncharacterized protein [Haliotis cracherodii]|uniref:uncharacterized protein n=1 Tax=Haliotis cracherodii TaxID=6455 RepID=UPI0039EAA080